LTYREEALAEKEKVILDLRNTTKTLENFRFVLDHRLQQLTAERGPITKHIEGLESHIKSMYEEMVTEFERKKSLDREVENRDMKIVTMSSELARLRQQVCE
jgi:predicted RNase H-like nuclease (RuvC/YqgF family)